MGQVVGLPVDHPGEHHGVPDGMLGSEPRGTYLGVHHARVSVTWTPL